jgi:hypothetical protein
MHKRTAVEPQPFNQSSVENMENSHPPSLEQRAQAWVSRWRAEDQRRRKIEKTLGSVSWRLDSSMDINSLEPELRKRILELLVL